MQTVADLMKTETYFDEYQCKAKAYDVQIDKEWAPFLGTVEWTDELMDKACVIAERQGKRQALMFDAYKRRIHG